VGVSSGRAYRNQHVCAGTVQPGEYILLAEIAWTGDYTRSYTVNSYSSGDV
jgi:hypothetical protein